MDLHNTRMIKLSPDTTRRFLFEHEPIRGQMAVLNQSYQTIMQQHGYPKSVARFLGEALVCSMLLIGVVKLKGQITIQFQSDGAIKMLVAKCNHLGHIRGLAQWRPDALQQDLNHALGQGELVVTMLRDDALEPYQSIVPLMNQSISRALEHYFMQSEQLPTRILLSVDDNQASGLLLQQMPDQTDDNNAWQSVNKKIMTFEQSQSVLAQWDVRVFEPQTIPM